MEITVNQVKRKGIVPGRDRGMGGEDGRSLHFGHRLGKRDTRSATNSRNRSIVTKAACPSLRCQTLA